MEFTLESIKQFINILPDQYMVITYEETEGLCLVACSDNTPAVFGMTMGEFKKHIGTDALDLILPQDRELVVNTVINGFKTGQPYEHIYRDIHKKTGSVWVHAKASFPGTLDGKGLCLTSINAVEAEKEPYETILGNSPYAICVIDNGTKEILYVNEECALMLNRSVADCAGRSILEVSGIHPEIQSVDILNKTCVYRVPDSGRIVDIRGIRSQWGVHHTTAVFISDVTEDKRKIAEAAVTAKEHLDAIMRMNPDAMSTFKINLTKNILSNGVSAYPNLIKLQEKNTVDGYMEDALEFFPFDEERRLFSRRFCCKNLLKEYEKGHATVSMVHHYMLTDRENRILNTIVKMVKNKVTGDIEGIVYTLDVTRETYYSRINRLLFDNANIGIIVINVKKKTFIMPQESKILNFQSSYEEQDYEKAAESILQEYIEEEDRERCHKGISLSHIAESLRKESRYVFNSSWNKNGERINMRLSCYYSDSSKEQIIGVLEDITEVTRWEKEQVERYRNALKQVEQANHAKSDFLSNMSHDIRTPLNAILNLSSLLHDELNDPKKLEEDIQKIEVAGEFLLQLVNDVLDVSAIESGKFKLKPVVYTYATFLNYIRGIIIPLCETKDVKFVLDEGPTALDIYMDRVRFHQIFFNILSNAVKYTPPGGTVTFRTTNNVIHDGILSCDFIVTDTGCGMSRQFLERVFEPFEREDDKNAYVGTGLGLTICKKILDLMGGTISIESEPGKGTKVTVHMDMQIVTEKQREDNQVEIDTSYHRNVTLSNEESIRILVVEDSEINREILTRLLEKKGFVVECAGNGREAVDKVKEKDGSYYQVILMDIRMPVMNGLEAASLIRQDPDEKKSRIPIIAITANAFDKDAEECIKAGMNSYLSKPISSNALYEMLAAYIQCETNQVEMLC